MNPILRFVKSVCVQTAVYWAAPIKSGYGAQSIFSNPVEIKVRWDDAETIVELMPSHSGGNQQASRQIVSRARVMVQQDLEENGFLFLGSIVDLDSGAESNPLIQKGAFQILRFIKTPLFRSSTEFVREVYL